MPDATSGCGCRGCREMAFTYEVDGETGEHKWTSIGPLRPDLYFTMLVDRVDGVPWLLSEPDREVKVELFEIGSGGSENVFFERTWWTEEDEFAFNDDGDRYHVRLMTGGIGGEWISGRCIKVVEDGDPSYVSTGYFSHADFDVRFYLHARPRVVDISPGRVLPDEHQGRIETVIEYRSDRDLPRSVRCRITLSEAGLLKTRLFQEIDNSARDRSDTCLRKEVCEYTPEKNSPRWKLSSVTPPEGVTLVDHNPTPGHNTCMSSHAYGDISIDAKLTVEGFSTANDFLAVYHWNGKQSYTWSRQRSYIDHRHRIKAAHVDVDPVLLTGFRIYADDENEEGIELEGYVYFTRWELNQTFGAFSGRGNSAFEIETRPAFWASEIGQISAVGDVDASDYEGETEYADYYNEVFMKKTWTADDSWDDAEFGEQPDDPDIPPTIYVSTPTQGSRNVPLDRVIHNEIQVKQVTEIWLGRALFTSYGLLVPKEEWVVYRKTVPKWTGAEPPEVTFTGDDLVATAFDRQLIKKVHLPLSEYAAGIENWGGSVLDPMGNQVLKVTADTETCDIGEFEFTFAPAEALSLEP